MNSFRLLLVVGLVLASSLAAQAQDLLPPDRPIAEVIDHYLDAKLRKANVEPAAQAAGSTLVRRLYLDLAGRIPTATEARSFSRTKEPFTRAKLIDALLAMPEFAWHNANEFDVLLRNDNLDAGSLHPYLLRAFNDNLPWDAMFRDLIGTAEKANSAKPENFVLKRLKNPDALARDVSSVFFGLNITCAQCHRHPEIKTLTQDYFFGMKAFFSYSYDFQGSLLERQYVKLADFKAKNGEVRKPALLFLSGTKVDIDAVPDAEMAKAIEKENKLIQEAAKTYAKSKQLPPAPNFRPRSRFVEIALDNANREMLARSIINRLWFRFYGHGLVMRIDQMHANNQPSHPELMQWLTRDLLAHNYDLKRLIAGLVSSRAYARSSEWQGKEPAKDLFAVAVVRPLTPPQWGVSHRLASDPDALKMGEPADVRLKKLDAQKAFGNLIEQPREEMQIGITESLKLSNDAALLKTTGDKLVPALQKIPDARQRIDAAVWAVLSRPASSTEVELFSDFLEQRKDRPEEALRHMVWALINSPEFRFNH